MSARGRCGADTAECQSAGGPMKRKPDVLIGLGLLAFCVFRRVADAQGQGAARSNHRRDVLRAVADDRWNRPVVPGAHRPRRAAIGVGVHRLAARPRHPGPHGALHPVDGRLCVRLHDGQATSPRPWPSSSWGYRAVPGNPDRRPGSVPACHDRSHLSRLHQIAGGFGCRNRRSWRGSLFTKIHQRRFRCPVSNSQRRSPCSPP